MLNAEAMILDGGLDLLIGELFPLILHYTISSVLIDTTEVSSGGCVDCVEQSGAVPSSLRHNLGKMAL